MLLAKTVTLHDPVIISVFHLIFGYINSIAKMHFMANYVYFTLKGRSIRNLENGTPYIIEVCVRACVFVFVVGRGWVNACVHTFIFVCMLFQLVKSNIYK